MLSYRMALTIAYFALLSFAFFAIGLDAVSYPGFIKRHLFFDARVIVGVCAITALAIICQQRIKLTNFLSIYLKANNLIILPLLFMATIFLTVIEMLTYPNFVFSTFHLNYDYFLYALLLSIVTTISFLDKKILKAKKNVFFFLGSFFLLFVGVLMRTWPHSAFFMLSKEDNLFENLQFLFYVSASILSLYIASQTFRKKSVILTVFYTLFSILMFLIAAEEISWGQRILQIQSPEIALQMNTQEEITVHNIRGINQYQYLFYMVFSLPLFTGWLLLKALPKKIQSFAIPITPPWYLSWYFIPIFVFYLYMNFFQGTHWEWQEFSELLLSLGLILYTINNYFL